jgi:hypothetical protein
MLDTPSDMDIFAHGAFQTPDTVWRIRIIGDTYLDRTHRHTQIAINTRSLNIHSHVAYTVEERVESAQGTQCPAEWPGSKDEKDEKYNENADLEHVQPSNHPWLNYWGCESRIDGIPNDPRNAGAQCPPGTDPREPVGFEQSGEQHCQNNQRDIFPVLQEFWYAEFSCLDFKCLILNPPKRTDPATNRTPKHQADRPKKSQEKERYFADGGEVLEYSDRT